MDSFAAILNFVWVSTSWLSLAVVNDAPRVLVNGSSTIIFFFLFLVGYVEKRPW